MKNLFKPERFYYLLFAYVVLSILWWSYLLLYNNRQNYLAERLAMTEQYRPQPGLQNQLDRLHADYVKDQLLISGEALAFLILTLFGARRVYYSNRAQVELARQQSNFILSITHELKSPLAGIRLALETLQKHELDHDQQQKFLGNALSDTQRLTEMVETVLTAARFEDRSFQIVREQLDLADIAAECAAQYQKQFGVENLETDIRGPLPVEGDRSLLVMALNNLLDNAFKYRNGREPVRFSALQTGNKSRVSISDDGPGIRDDEKQKIFEKFYRPGDETTRSSKGTGLGLFIVHEIAVRHNARVWVKDNPGGGSIFFLEMPLI